MSDEDLVHEYRKSVAEWARQHAVYSATTPGTADANGEEERLHRMVRSALNLEDQLLRRLGAMRNELEHRAEKENPR